MDLLLAIDRIANLLPSAADLEREQGPDDSPPTASMLGKLTREAEEEYTSEMAAEPACSEILDEQVIEAGALLILACMAGRSFARMWKPGMNDIPHSGSLPREEVLLERNLPLEVDATFSVNGRPWLMLK